MEFVHVISQLDASHLEQLPALIAAATRVDGHEPLGEHKFLRLGRGEDLASAVLAFENDSLVGYAHTVTYGERDARRTSCELVVHPEHRRNGLGRRLLEAALAQARLHAARTLDVWAYNDKGAGDRLARDLGFDASRRLLHLHRHMRDVPTVAAPQGISLRSIRPGIDDERWLELNNRIFNGHQENGSWTLDDLRARLTQPWFDARDFLLLEAGDEIAGFCWLKIEEREGEGRVGEIYVIGTAPEHRGRGLGRYLLQNALTHLADRGADVAAIYVDEANATAVSLYESCGFHYHHVDVCYSRDLIAPAVLTPHTEETAA